MTRGKESEKKKEEKGKEKNKAKHPLLEKKGASVEEAEGRNRV